jgi:hypothetical protein
MERVDRNISSARECHNGMREVSQPLKRPQPAGRSAINVEESSGRSDGLQQVDAKDGALTKNRNGNNGDKTRASNGKGKKKKSLFCRILVTIVAMFLVIEMAIRQASNLMLVSQSDYFSAHHSRHHNSCSPRVSMPSKIMSADDDDMMDSSLVKKKTPWKYYSCCLRRGVEKL